MESQILMNLCLLVDIQIDERLKIFVLSLKRSRISILTKETAVVFANTYRNLRIESQNIILLIFTPDILTVGV